jgi:hypothetical protein
VCHLFRRQFREETHASVLLQIQSRPCSPY